MKQLLSAMLITLFLGCSTSTENDPDRIGTWRIDSPEHATWVGSNQSQPMKVAFSSSGNDTTSPPDTTYFYTNERIQAEITELEREVYEGDFAFHITDQTLNTAILVDSLRFGGITVENLGESFEVNNIRGTNSNEDRVVFKIQMNYDCSSTNNDTGDLILAFYEWMHTDSIGVPDTLFYYQLSTEGLYSTADYISCN